MAYNSKPITEDSFYSQNGTGQEERHKKEFQRLIYGLCFFHGVALERHRYGPAGWNNKYAFNMSDLNISLHQMKEALGQVSLCTFRILFVTCDEKRGAQQKYFNYFLLKRASEDLDEATLEAIQYLVAECNYGGRITDTHDRRLLTTLLQRLVNLKMATEEGYDLANKPGLYTVPEHLSRQNINEQIKRMNVVPHPEGLGLSENSALVRDLRDSKRLLHGVLLTQPGLADQVKKSGALQLGMQIKWTTLHYLLQNIWRKSKQFFSLYYRKCLWKAPLL